MPAVNQIENHPALPQQEIVDLCKEKGIHIMAYSPLGSTGGPLFNAEPVVQIAGKHGVKPATVLLSYHRTFFFCSSCYVSYSYRVKLLTRTCRSVARGSTVLAKSVTPERIKENMNLIELDADDMKLLNDYSDRLTKEGKLQRFVYPPFGVDFGFPDKS